jgi:hypothetical protein
MSARRNYVATGAAAEWMLDTSAPDRTRNNTSLPFSPLHLCGEVGT